ASGERLSANPSIDSAAYRISKRMEMESKFSGSAQKNLENAYTLAQQQADIISYAEVVIKRMNVLAYQATDPISSNYDREVLNREFQESSKTLESLMFDRTFNKQILDPQSADYIDRTIVYPDQETDSGVYSKKIDISAVGGKVKLWWNSYNSRDRIQLKQGDRWFFDSGEYLSDNGNGVRSETVDGQTINGDYFEIDFQPNQISYTTASDNKGDSNSVLAPGYPKTRAPLGNSTVIDISVNEPGPEGVVRSGSIDWTWSISIDPQQIDGPQGMMDEKGSLYELSPLGFSTLKGYDISTRINAGNALERSEQELESLRTQIYTLAKTFSEIRLKSDQLGHKKALQEIAIGRINDTDLADEYLIMH
ncbi:MAG: flagellin N-terminal helical domain-containing protein, partial [Verrucomicrobiia bacterium]